MPVDPPRLGHLTPENLRLLDILRERDLRIHQDLSTQIPILFRPCSVRVLLVADGGLDFSANDFGLRTFVETLLATTGFHVRFKVTLGHINGVSGDAIMAGDSRIVRGIPQFKFDDPSHFAVGMYDQVWLFGIDTFYSRGLDTNGQPYPSTQLSDKELRAISDFMNAGGGLFATGDHGLLGTCLCSAIPRARSMRLWADTSGNNNTNEVSMSGPRRNDTNRLGDAGSQFNDQSDDIPQTIQPKMYHRYWGFWVSSFPHPLLCGPNGVIRVMPDHPHEGQCIEPADPDQSFDFGSGAKPEYPTGTGPRPLPEVISWSTVLAGTTSGVKSPTQPHSFGSISAYDGHRAGVGRVVTDATWHHFVNINLVGDLSVPVTNPKRFGFLATAQGQAHLEEIKTYYRNIATWISTPALITCMNNRLLWWLVWNERVMEATLTTARIRLASTPAYLIWQIGKHARDVLGRYAGQCQSNGLADWLLDSASLSSKLRLSLDPWAPLPPKERAELAEQVPWNTLEPALDMAVGGAVVALREAFGEPGPKLMEALKDQAIGEVIADGVRTAYDLSMKSMAASTNRVTTLFAPAPVKSAVKSTAKSSTKSAVKSASKRAKRKRR